MRREFFDEVRASAADECGEVGRFCWSGGVTTLRASTKSRRIVRLDIARAFAIAGMVIVNFKITTSAEPTGPQWLHTFAALFDGRAAVTFVILAAAIGTGVVYVISLW